MIIQSAEFLVSSQEYGKCPEPRLPEFAFIGRSNVGKSSLINMLVQRKDLAKVSGTPGK
ncbi:MAG: GTPase, partial [Flammeovirgaceae bacterium]